MRAWALLPLCVSLACDVGDAPQPLRGPAPMPARSELETREPVETDAVDPYTYEARGKRDPFRGLADVEPPEGCLGSLLPCWSLDQLKLIGVIEGRTPIAMVEDPLGLGHVVSWGTILGNSSGRVVSIGNGALRVREEWRDEIGRKQTRETELTLKRRRGTPM